MFTGKRQSRHVSRREVILPRRTIEALVLMSLPAALAASAVEAAGPPGTAGDDNDSGVPFGEMSASSGHRPKDRASSR